MRYQYEQAAIPKPVFGETYRMKPLPKQRWETVFDHRDI